MCEHVGISGIMWKAGKLRKKQFANWEWCGTVDRDMKDWETVNRNDCEPLCYSLVIRNYFGFSHSTLC